MSARRSPVAMPNISRESSAVEAFAVGEVAPRAGVVKLLSAGEAQRLTQQIKLTASGVRNGLFKLRNLIDEAKGSNAWNVLGFASWTAYLVDALGDEPMRVSREERIELVGYLAGEGLSRPAIAAVTGVAERTIIRDARVVEASQGMTDVTPSKPAVEREQTVAPVAPADGTGRVEASPTPPRSVTGLDGKTYTRPVVSEEARERAEAERASQQEWNAFRDLYCGIARSVSTLAAYATYDPEHLFRHFEAGMFTPIEEREFTPERMRAAITTMQRFIEWKESK